MVWLSFILKRNGQRTIHRLKNAGLTQQYMMKRILCPLTVYPSPVKMGLSYPLGITRVISARKGFRSFGHTMCVINSKMTKLVQSRLPRLLALFFFASLSTLNKKNLATLTSSLICTSDAYIFKQKQKN